VLLAAGGGSTAEVLRQNQPAGGGSAPPDATAPAAPTSLRSAASTDANGSNTVTQPGAGSRTQAVPAPTPDLPPVHQSPTGRATPTPRASKGDITRSYSKNNQGAGKTFCSGQVGGSQTHAQDTFCGDGYASETAIDAEHRVPLQSYVCESAGEIGSKSLTFDTSREVDYAIYQGSTLIWRWSSGKPAATRPGHSLAIDPGECWFWKTTWRAVDSHGRARHGSFVLRTTSYAKELTSVYNPSSYSFTL
jgi:hypothetical protein